MPTLEERLALLSRFSNERRRPVGEPGRSRALRPLALAATAVACLALAVVPPLRAQLVQTPGAVASGLAPATLLHTGAEAGMVASLDEPAVFPDAALNVVVLPYQTDKAVGRPLGGPARELGLLLQLDSLLTLGRYGGFGTVYLHSRGDGEDPPEESVEDQLLDRKPGAGAVVQPGQALIVVWGRIYQEGPDIYLQTYLRFLRRGKVDGIERWLASRLGGGVFRARTPVEAINFPPRRLTETDLLQIEREFQKGARVYARPSEDAPSEPLPVTSREPVAFGVDRVEGDWLQVSGASIGTGKWLKARVDPREWPLRRRMPELDFLDAIAGYLQYRVAADGPGRRMEAIPRWVEESLTRYRESSGEGGGAAPVPEALGKILLGNLQMLAGHPEAAEPLYRQAAVLLPYSADAPSLGALARLAQIRDADLARDAGSLEGVWREALALEPANLDVLGDLATLYGLQLRKGGATGASREDLLKKLAAVKRVRAGVLKKIPPRLGMRPS
jgi:hypothetical protein